MNGTEKTDPPSWQIVCCCGDSPIARPITRAGQYASPAGYRNSSRESGSTRPNPHAATPSTTSPSEEANGTLVRSTRAKVPFAPNNGRPHPGLPFALAALHGRGGRVKERRSATQPQQQSPASLMRTTRPSKQSQGQRAGYSGVHVVFAPDSTTHGS